jgi:enoyl-CoA hydratase/carnithine racemase
MDSTAEILFQQDRDGIAILTVNRPEARNALNWAAQEQFAAIIAATAAMADIRVLIITGAGERSFVSGGDLKELCCDPGRQDGRRLNTIMSAALDDLARRPFPVIAAINGDAFGGGCELITACDLRLARPGSRFSFAQVRNGLTTGWGGAARLVRQIGQSRALELLLSGRMVSAAEAQQMGLVHRLTPPGQTTAQSALAWANDLAALPASAVAALKKLVYAAPQLDDEQMRALETTLFLNLWGSPDHREALAAFAEKRPPRFNQAPPADEPSHV